MRRPHAFHAPSRARCGLLSLIGALVSILTAAAFPPAPPTTLYGVVRGEFGYKIDDGETKLVLLADGVAIARTVIEDTGEVGVNYRLVLPLDLNPDRGPYRSGTATEEADVVYSVVAMRGILQIPVLEVNFSLDSFVPDAGGLVKIDFVLGEDTDGDGLPDAWERFQVSSVGGHEGEDALALITPEGDLDGDGMSNFDEYIAGTFALLFEDALDFRIVDVADDGRTSLEFFAVDGKAYTVEVSDDAMNWARIHFETNDAAPEAISIFRAAETQMEIIHRVHSLGTPRKFYRLRVQ